MLLLELEKIKNLFNQIKILEQSVHEGFLEEADAIVTINLTMKKIEKLKYEYVDKRHNWNDRDKKPRIKSRRGTKIEYYMTHIKIGKETKQLSASTLDSLYEKLYDFYANDSSIEMDKDITVRELHKIYYNLRRKDADEYHIITSKTADVVMLDWKRFFEKSSIADMKVINITQRQIFNEFKRLTGSGLLTRKAFNPAKGLLDGMFDIAVEAGIIDFNPSRIISVKRLRFKPEKDKQNEVYTMEERNAILKYLKEKNKQTIYTLAIQLAFCFCLRIGELKALTWDDYDETNRTIFIWHQVVERKEGKKKRALTDVPFTKAHTQEGNRLLYVTDEAARILSELKIINGDKKYILNSKGNKPIVTSHFNEHLKLYCDEAGIRYFSSHKIRFYGATELFNAGVDAEQIRRIMGHTNLAMTEHYNRTDGKIMVDKEIWNRIFNSDE